MVAVFSALLAANASALLKVLFRSYMREGQSALHILQFHYVLGSVCVLLVFGVPELPSPSLWPLVLVSGLCWVSGMYFQMRSYNHLHASESNIIGSLALIVVAAAGIFCFHEPISLYGIIGFFFIFFSVWGGTDIRRFKGNLGVRCRLWSVLFFSAALILDRVLVTEMSLESLAVYSFLLPAALLVMVDIRGAIALPSLLRDSSTGFLLSPGLAVLRSVCVLLALSSGGLAVTFALLSTGVLFVYFYETALFRLCEWEMRRGMCCLCCAFGAMLVSAFG